MNFDNAISDTTTEFPDFTGTYEKIENTDHNEPRWVVRFFNTQIPKFLLIEVIERDGGVVMSVLERSNINLRETTAIMEAFTEHIRIW